MLTKQLDKQVAQFRIRSLEEKHFDIWFDTLYGKIRCDGRVINMAALIVVGLTVEWYRPLLLCESTANN